ncbi:uncharacterized protein AMSG_10355 [Thecamonas trahens ATCC 50062]|uniref:HIT domain-containing protein n=1 Tax=Thecamonas trahens ATCC 50062 TaxID=461836 RepID=A0A0L0DPY3_THETB|nr:hypothetical protein AMSG_10355 [Thecamonas trahens ATCC 50062]KNC54362.1 hypothetical protein AMSG_10355 [Thecamonas trahens ATCC 50062]|eukprot:XP_013753816.1 hypothetical protein AMSG_10355 [Thecamonas trahens ATCC 50062]
MAETTGRVGDPRPALNTTGRSFEGVGEVWIPVSQAKGELAWREELVSGLIVESRIEAKVAASAAAAGHGVSAPPLIFFTRQWFEYGLALTQDRDGTDSGLGSDIGRPTGLVEAMASETEDFVAFVDAVINVLEVDLGLVDYHWQLLLFKHAVRGKKSPIRAHGVRVYYGNVDRDGPYNSGLTCLSCETASVEARQSFVTDNEEACMWLDAKGRPMWVVTPRRHVDALSECTAAEKMAIFQLAATGLGASVAAAMAKEPAGFRFSTLKLNHGTYRNWEHLHLKISLHGSNWRQVAEAVAASLPGERTDLLDRLDTLRAEAAARKAARKGWKR